MDVKLAYLGRSTLTGDDHSKSLSFAPNLARDPVAFNAAIKNPLRFREAISALHDVVISDLRFKPRDKTAYLAYKEEQQRTDRTIYQRAFQEAKTQAAVAAGVTPQQEKEFQKAVRRYWGVRQEYSDFLRKYDPHLWRLLMPCDPVITAAEDVVFFECFSADESSYGCLTIERAAFGACDNYQYGTTNVDYSQKLYEQFQSLRTYRATRLAVDSEGFNVKTTGRADYREERIDLPEGWLRGFMQLQAAMTLPMRKVSLSTECVYSLLAWMKRHKANKSPRALRFELIPGQSPRLVLEPWEQVIISHGTRYDGPSTPPVRIWGTRRLMFLSRALPLTDRFDVHLLGTGLPSFWIARMGEMRLTIGASGWTTNDWSRGSALDAFRPPGGVLPQSLSRVSEIVRAAESIALDSVISQSMLDKGAALGALEQLARSGQVIYDLDALCFRWRQIMPRAVAELDLGPESPEVAAANSPDLQRQTKILSRQSGLSGGEILTAKSGTHNIELLINSEGLITRGKCNCSHHFKFGLRKGPCRHLQAARNLALAPVFDARSPWYEWAWKGSRN
jgi:hypothetical protein